MLRRTLRLSHLTLLLLLFSTAGCKREDFQAIESAEPVDNVEVADAVESVEHEAADLDLAELLQAAQTCNAALEDLNIGLDRVNTNLETLIELQRAQQTVPKPDPELEPEPDPVKPIVDDIAAAWRTTADLILEGKYATTKALLYIVDNLEVNGELLDTSRLDAIRGPSRDIDPDRRHEWAAWILQQGPLPLDAPIEVDELVAAIIYDKDKGASPELNRAQYWGLTNLPGRFRMLDLDETESSLMNEPQWVRDAFAARGATAPWLIVADKTHGLSEQFESLQQFIDATRLERE